MLRTDNKQAYFSDTLTNQKAVQMPFAVCFWLYSTQLWRQEHKITLPNNSCACCMAFAGVKSDTAAQLPVSFLQSISQALTLGVLEGKGCDHSF